jgi:hypothetical protein
MSATGWQGNRNGRRENGSPPCDQEKILSDALSSLKSKQAKLTALLIEANKLHAEISTKLSKFGLPHQKPLPFISYALKHQKIYRGNSSCQS